MIKASRLFAFGLLSLSTASAAYAADAYPKACDATYEIKNRQGITPMHMYSNGKGQTRTESTPPGGGKTVSIIDYPNHAVYTILEAQKMIMKSGSPGDSGKKMDAEQAKKLGATDLGTKMVNNHMAHGWTYKTGPTTSEVWVDEAEGLTVKSIGTTAGNTTEMNLKSTAQTVPPDSFFKVPTSGYKVTVLQGSPAH